MIRGMMKFIPIILLLYFVGVSLSKPYPSGSRPNADEGNPPLCFPCRCVTEDDGMRLKADCSNRKLGAIPLKLPSNIVSLNLAGNKVIDYVGTKGICEIYKELKSLSFAQNSLKRLPQEVLKGCERTLKELDLTGNTLTIKSNDFIHLTNLAALKGLTVSNDFRNEFFRPLKKLRRLEFSYAGLSFSMDLFADLPELKSLRLELTNAFSFDNSPLMTIALDELFLRAPKLRRLPESLLTTIKDLTKLDLDLPELDSLNWPNQNLFSSLKHLSIQGVWKVDAKTIEGMRSLQTLQLTRIENLEDSSLFDLNDRLQVLEISNCELQALPSTWFSGLRSLTDLNMTNNHLRRLDKDSLFGLTNLRNLILSGNKFVNIPVGFLDHVAETLEYLSMDRNRLTTLDILPDMKNLMALDLSQNSFRQIDLSIFRHTPGLVHLQLQENIISNFIGQMPNGVQRVNLSYNFLFDVPEGMLVKSLMDLDISGNPLRPELPVSKFMRLENLRELRINDLTVKCDCPLQQLVKSKAVHGGLCETQKDEAVHGLRRVGDILNDRTLCDETTTSRLTGNSYSIMERSLVKTGFEKVRNKTDIENETKNKDTTDILKRVKKENTSEISHKIYKPLHKLLNMYTKMEKLIDRESHARGSDITNSSDAGLYGEVAVTNTTKDTIVVNGDLDQKNSAHLTPLKENGRMSQNKKKVLEGKGSDVYNESIFEVSNSIFKKNTTLGVIGKYEDVENETDGELQLKVLTDFPVTVQPDVGVLRHKLQYTNQKSDGELQNGEINDVPSTTQISAGNRRTEVPYNTQISSGNGRPEVPYNTQKSSTDEVQNGVPTGGHSQTLTSVDDLHSRVSIDVNSTTTTPTSVIEHGDSSSNVTVQKPVEDVEGNATVEHVKGTIVDIDTDQTSDENDNGLPVVVWLIIALAFLVLIGCVIALVRRIFRSGSHSLERSRRNNRRASVELDETKMVMTELGKSRPGQDVLVM